MPFLSNNNGLTDLVKTVSGGPSTDKTRSWDSSSFVDMGLQFHTHTHALTHIHVLSLSSQNNKWSCCRSHSKTQGHHVTFFRHMWAHTHTHARTHTHTHVLTLTLSCFSAQHWEHKTKQNSRGQTHSLHWTLRGTNPSCLRTDTHIHTGLPQMKRNAYIYTQKNKNSITRDDSQSQIPSLGTLRIHQAMTADMLICLHWFLYTVMIHVIIQLPRQQADILRTFLLWFLTQLKSWLFF